MSAQYYLHSNGTLIYKPGGDVQYDSTFVKRIWSVDDISKTPSDFVEFLDSAYLAGANMDEIYRLANHNSLSEYQKDWEYTVFNNLIIDDYLYDVNKITDEDINLLRIIAITRPKYANDNMKVRRIKMERAKKMLELAKRYRPEMFI